MSGKTDRGIAIAVYILPVCVYLFFHLFFPFRICDDAYITLKTAVNLSDGNGLVFNAGEKAYVITNPLWAVMLSAGHSLGFDIQLVMRFLCVFFQITFLLSAVYLGHLVTKNTVAGALFAILMITNPIYFLSSDRGMEYALFFTVIVLGIIAFIRKNYIWSLIAGSIALWVRFDGILFYLVLLISYIYVIFKNREQPLPKRVTVLIPSLIIFIAYFLFAYFYYGDIIPQSVQMKASESPSLFSGEWREGAYNTFMQLVYAINFGCLGFFFTSPGFDFVFTIFSFVAWFHFFASKQYESLTLVLYALLYSVVFIGNGSNDAAGYSWYYCPTFLLAYLFSAWGVFIVFKSVIKPQEHKKSIESSMLLFFVLILLAWTPLSVSHISKNVKHLEAIEIKREKAFAACAIWSGKHLPQNACIAGDDIGALGFFARPDIKVVDIYGILRTPQDKHKNRIDILKRERPEAIFLRFPKLFKGEINSGMPNEYVWFTLPNIEIGLRSDIAKNLSPDEAEFDQIAE